MARKRIKASSDAPYFIYGESLTRDWFALPMEDVWGVLENYLFLVKHGFKIKIYAFVLMPDSFQLIAAAPEGNLGEALLYLMRESSKELTRMAGRINQSYHNQHRKTLLPNQLAFLNCYKYVYRTPMREGFTTRVEDFKYSTLHGLLGQKKLIIPVEDDCCLFSPNFEAGVLDWLNSIPNCDSEDDLRRALRRSVYTLPRCRRKKSRNHLESNLL